MTLDYTHVDVGRQAGGAQDLHNPGAPRHMGGMSDDRKPSDSAAVQSSDAPDTKPAGKSAPKAMPKEIGGPKGPEPTRYGDWEQKGRCTDF